MDIGEVKEVGERVILLPRLKPVRPPPGRPTPAVNPRPSIPAAAA